MSMQTDRFDARGGGLLLCSPVGDLTGDDGGSGGGVRDAGLIGTGGSASSIGGGAGASGQLPGDIAKAAGTPLVAAHSLTRAMYAAYSGPLFKVLRVSDRQEGDIGVVAAGGLVDSASLTSFCSGTTCELTTLYEQSGNRNDMWRGDVSTNQPDTPIVCELMDIEFWHTSDGTKLPLAAEEPKTNDRGHCLRNRNKTKNMPMGAQPETQWAISMTKRCHRNPDGRHNR